MFDRIFKTGLTRQYESITSQDYFVNKMIGTNRFMNCLETGSGKTKIVVEGIEELMNAGFIRGGLILAPSTGVWMKNFNDWASPEFRARINIREVVSSRKKDILCQGTHFFLMTYHTLSSIYNMYRNVFNRWEGKAILVLDESHAIKNFGSQRTKRCIDISRFFEFRTCMTATPTDKGYENLWGMLRILLPSDTPEKHNSFVEEIAVVERKQAPWKHDKTGKPVFYSKIVRYKHGKVKEYMDRLEPYICRGTTDIQAKRDIDIRFLLVDSDKGFSRMYRIFCMLLTGSGVSNKRGIFTMVRLFLGNPLLFKGKGWDKIKKYSNAITRGSWAEVQQYVNNFVIEKHTKISWLLNHVKEYFEHEKQDRLVIWFYHPEVAELVSEELERRNIKTKLLISRTRNAKDYVYNAVEEFNSKDELKVLVTTVGVLKESHSLRGVSVGIVFAPPLSFYEYTQLNGRMCGINRGIEGKRTQMLYLIQKSSIDQSCYRLLKRKKQISDCFQGKTAMGDREWKDFLTGDL